MVLDVGWHGRRDRDLAAAWALGAWSLASIKPSAPRRCAAPGRARLAPPAHVPPGDGLALPFASASFASPWR
jgi:hypothetical protein